MGIKILALGSLYFASRAFSLIFARYRIPDVLLLMLLGILLGPVLQWVDPQFFGEAGGVITTIALVVILFEGGLGTRFEELMSALGPSTQLTLISFLVTLALGATIVYVLGSDLIPGIQYSWSILESLVFGTIIAGTSSAVVIPMLSYLKTGSLVNRALMLESALTDVLCIVATFALLQVMLQSGDLKLGVIIGSTFASLFFAVLVGVIGGIFWVWAWKKIVAMKNELFTTIAFALVIYGFCEFLGFSGAIAALAFGFTLNNYDSLPPRVLQRLGPNLPNVLESERSLYRELVFLLKTFFFVYLGLQMPIKDWQPHLIAFAIIVVVYSARHLICRLILKTSKDVSVRDQRIASLLIPKGLAAAVLATVPGQMGLSFGPDLESLVYAIVLQSIVLTSVLIWLDERRRVE